MAADMDQVAFGIIVGGTAHDNTTAFTDRRQVKLLHFMGNADGATTVIKTKDPSGAWVTVEKLSSTDTGELGESQVWFGETGSTFDGMQVDNNHNDDLLAIHFV